MRRLFLTSLCEVLTVMMRGEDCGKVFCDKSEVLFMKLTANNLILTININFTQPEEKPLCQLLSIALNIYIYKYYTET